MSPARSPVVPGLLSSLPGSFLRVETVNRSLSDRLCLVWPLECNRNSINSLFSKWAFGETKAQRHLSLSPIPPSLSPPITHTHTHTHTHRSDELGSSLPPSLPQSYPSSQVNPGPPAAPQSGLMGEGPGYCLFITGLGGRTLQPFPAPPPPPPAPLPNPTFILMK